MASTPPSARLGFSLIYDTAELAYLNTITQVFIKPFLLLNFNNLGYR